MSKKSVFCVATSRGQADQIVDQLKTACGRGIGDLRPGRLVNTNCPATAERRLQGDHNF